MYHTQTTQHTPPPPSPSQHYTPPHHTPPPHRRQVYNTLTSVYIYILITVYVAKCSFSDIPQQGSGYQTIPAYTIYSVAMPEYPIQYNSGVTGTTFVFYKKPVAICLFFIIYSVPRLVTGLLSRVLGVFVTANRICYNCCYFYLPLTKKVT